MTDNPSRDAASFRRLSLDVEGPLVRQFLLLLQQGVWIRRRVGCTVDVFLREELGAGTETVEKIQSIMLDGRPVDDIGSALIHDGSVLALSAAMPGLVGATLRRAGALASFRGTITYHETDTACSRGEGWVRIKVFNLLMAELGPGLLRRGVLLDAGELVGFLTERSRDLGQGCSVTLDGRAVEIARLQDDPGPLGAGRILLTVSSGKAAA